MARILPSLDSFQPANGGELAEHECLKLLRDNLPETYTVFHHLGWHTTKEGQDYFGELDVVVATPAGRVICLEIKAGKLDFSDTGINKSYGGERKDVIGQAKRQHAALIASLRAAGLHNQISHYLVLPHHRVEGPGTLTYPRERIIDADDYAQLPARLLQLDSDTTAAHADAQKRLERHLYGMFNVVQDVDAADQSESALVRKIADGLATWVLRIESPSKAYLVEATAGSGKTQLALALLNEAAARKERMLYVCFNRMLAEHIARLAPAQANVETFHQLCRDVVERSGEEVDFSAQGIFDHLAQRFAELTSTHTGHYDCIIVDEAQDFAIEWIASLIALGTGEHRLYVLQDDNQRLYNKEAFELAGATLIRSSDNFRSPRQLVDLINLLGLTEQPVRACAPYAGETPEVITYTADNPASLLKATNQAVEECLRDGYKPDQIVVLSVVGKERSVVLAEEHLAKLSLKRFSGRFDRNGNPVWIDGELLADTIFRFKGRSAPAVVLTEIDFERLEAKEKKRLFVGITRARRHLKLVMSHKAENALSERITAHSGR